MIKQHSVTDIEADLYYKIKGHHDSDENIVKWLQESQPVDDKELTYGEVKAKQSKPNFNSGYIKASPEAYDLLVEMGYGKPPMGVKELLSWRYILIPDGNLMLHGLNTNAYDAKQFYINNGALSWDEPEGKEDGQMEMENVNNSVSDSINTNKLDNQSPSITDDDGKEYKFEKPDFIVKLLCVAEGYIFGYIKDDVGLLPASHQWNLNGYGIDNSDYNLTPIKPWYEEEANFPAFVINLGYSKGKVILNKKQAENMQMERWREATKEEHASLYYKDK